MPVKFTALLGVILLGCVSSSRHHDTHRGATAAEGPWLEVPSVEMPTEDASIPISLLRDAASALLKRPGARACDPMTKRPIAGLSTEYCSTIYVAGGPHSLSWRVTEPSEGRHGSCRPYFVVNDADFPAERIWVVGYVHNHPCAALPSSLDLLVWPTDAFDPYVAMAEVRLVPGNPVPASYEHSPIEMASALVAERADGSRIFLRYFPTGEIQQWSDARSTWVPLGVCTPRVPDHRGRGRMPSCGDEPLRLLRE